jgi:hypothetical protein
VIQPKYFVDPEDASEYANFRVPVMDRREQNGVGIFVFDEIVKGVCFHQWITKMLVIQKSKLEHNNISKNLVCLTHC